MYVHPSDEHAPPAAKYVMRQTPKEALRTGSLSSSLVATPKIMRAVLRRPPPRRPATELLEKATWRDDYLGVVPNPGHAPNSLLYGKGKSVYEVRFFLLLQWMCSFFLSFCFSRSLGVFLVCAFCGGGGDGGGIVDDYFVVAVMVIGGGCGTGGDSGRGGVDNGGDYVVSAVVIDASIRRSSPPTERPAFRPRAAASSLTHATMSTHLRPPYCHINITDSFLSSFLPSIPSFLLTGDQVVDPRRRKDKDTPVFDRRHRSDSLSGSVAALQAMGLADIPRRSLFFGGWGGVIRMRASWFGGSSLRLLRCIFISRMLALAAGPPDSRWSAVAILLNNTTGKKSRLFCSSCAVFQLFPTSRVCHFFLVFLVLKKSLAVYCGRRRHECMCARRQ